MTRHAKSTDLFFANFQGRIDEALAILNKRFVFFITSEEAKILLLANGRRERIGIGRLDPQNRRALENLGLLKRTGGKTQRALFCFTSTADAHLEFRQTEQETRWFEIEDGSVRSGEWRQELLSIANRTETEVVADYEAAFATTDEKRLAGDQPPVSTANDRRILDKAVKAFQPKGRKITMVLVTPEEAAAILDLDSRKERRLDHDHFWRLDGALTNCGFFVTYGTRRTSSTQIVPPAADFVRFRRFKGEHRPRVSVIDGSPEPDAWKRDLEAIATEATV